ncbi:uncharacterized protein PgNI_12075 [Pyricularia grisea]|uniref:Uncharacterized protein n=1 Tax=Pyricularia grisea TaxID=148305 RepID=A0A6P8AQH2_PYRGI|nr:uncharacterized protein PgNI_12075 [Pyricularia grisea]TLD04289.1 hypothetical protein PgNI_12075 [Pyricularia grisea]
MPSEYSFIQPQLVEESGTVHSDLGLHKNKTRATSGKKVTIVSRGSPAVEGKVVQWARLFDMDNSLRHNSVCHMCEDLVDPCAEYRARKTIIALLTNQTLMMYFPSMLLTGSCSTFVILGVSWAKVPRSHMQKTLACCAGASLTDLTQL